MNRRAFIAGVGAASVSPLVGCAKRGSGDTYRNPVFEHVFADPDAVRADDGTFYAYATYGNWDNLPRRLIPIAHSQTLTEWEYAGEAFMTKPDWRGGDDFELWAPGVARLQGRYVLYYSLMKSGDPNPAIGVAVSEVPAGPFTDRGKLLQSAEIDVPNSIDPCPFIDDGTPYLFLGSMQGIYGIRLSPDGLALAGDPFQIAGDGVEAPYVIERDGRYYFFGSRGSCCRGANSTYHVVVGRSQSLDGPYVNQDGEPLLQTQGTTILHGNDAFVGPGHNTVVRDDRGAEWLLYHTYERGNPWVGKAPRRVLMLSRLRWEDGWPTVEGTSPDQVVPAPTIRGANRE